MSGYKVVKVPFRTSLKKTARALQLALDNATRAEMGVVDLVKVEGQGMLVVLAHQEGATEQEETRGGSRTRRRPDGPDVMYLSIPPAFHADIMQCISACSQLAHEGVPREDYETHLYEPVRKALLNTTGLAVRDIRNWFKTVLSRHSEKCTNEECFFDTHVPPLLAVLKRLENEKLQ
jgi:hypothetical protein